MNHSLVFLARLPELCDLSLKTRDLGGSGPGLQSPLSLGGLICEVGIMTLPHQAPVSEREQVAGTHLTLCLDVTQM